MRLKDLAQDRVSYGYRRLHILLQKEGWAVNHKRVYRLYRLGQASRAVRPGIQAHVSWLEKELDDLDQCLRDTVRSRPSWRRRMTCCARFPGWANSSPCRSWHICRNWVHWTESRLLRSSVWRPSIGTAE